MYKKMIKRIICFIICFTLVFLITEKTFFIQEQSYMWNKIYDEGKEDFDMLFLGSSLFFRNINAPLINETTGLNTGVLGCGNSNLKIALNDLKLVLEQKKVKVLCIDAYLPLNDSDYPSDSYGVLVRHNDGIPNVVDRVRANMSELPLLNWPESVFQICRPTLMWDRWRGKEQVVIEDYGFWPLYEIKKEIILNGFTTEMMQQDCEDMEKFFYELPDKRNEELLEELIELAHEKGCEVWVISMPRLDEGFIKEEAGQIQNTFKIASECGVKKCMELNGELIDIGLQQEDYRDKRHLNANGANKVTSYLIDNYIKDIFGIEIDYPRHEIKEEGVEKLKSSRYRYFVETYGKCYYKFTYFKNGYAETVKEFSSENYIEINDTLQENEKIYYEIADRINGEILKKGYFIKVVE